MKSYSFKKKVKSVVNPIAGCYPSLYTHHLLTSTGVPDLDTLLGGGLPVGTILLIEEDYSGAYSKLLLKYFLSEGVFNKHSLFYSSITQDPEALIQNLPSFEEHTSSNQTGAEGPEEQQLKIAWRYQNAKPETASSEKIGTRHSFNLQKPLQKSTLDQCDIKLCTLAEEGEERFSVHLLRKLNQFCQDKGFCIDSDVKSGTRNIARIGLHSVGDVLWGETQEELLVFLLALRSILRNCYGVAVLTVPQDLAENIDFRDRLERCADFVVRLNSFEAQEVTHPAYKDYHGILSVERIASLGVLCPPGHLLKENCELVFKSRRNRFLIEKFHLPPDLSEAVSRDQKDPHLKKKIDF